MADIRFIMYTELGACSIKTRIPLKIRHCWLVVPGVGGSATESLYLQTVSHSNKGLAPELSMVVQSTPLA
jgi:hypothetical protein